jgi:ribosomal protein S18 acetylase RimI-like enzyme
MLRNCIEFASNQNCKKVKLHVQQINEDAIEFYKKNGFCEVCIEQNYYKRLEKPDAVVMCKEL